MRPVHKASATGATGDAARRATIGEAEVAAPGLGYRPKVGRPAVTNRPNLAFPSDVRASVDHGSDGFGGHRRERRAANLCVSSDVILANWPMPSASAADTMRSFSSLDT